MKASQIESMAEVCHDLNRVYCEYLGDKSQVLWEKAPEWQKASAMLGVKFHLENPDSKPEDSHNAWLKQKELDGWKFGPIKDADKKEHPCMIPYKELPQEQQIKDLLFLLVVRAQEQFFERETHVYGRSPAFDS